ncbi:MAG: hypothetical protein IT266_06005 [Saprospiraceae bacterium]|nr:hypothetical protein [Saprospiraceae bacterium]
MRNFVTLLGILLTNCLLFSQLKSILVLNEGAYDYVNGKSEVPVSLGRYDLQSKTYQELVQVDDARFASDLALTGKSAWVAADQWLIEFDRTSWQVLNQINIPGIRKFAMNDDYVVVTRGEYLKKLSSYVQVYHRSGLKLAYEIPEADMPYTTESIIIDGDRAYVGVNNGFEFGKEVGKVLVIDLKTLQWISTIDLGPDGKNPENLMRFGQKLVSLNNKSYNGSSISVIDLAAADVKTHSVTDVQSLCGTSVLVGESVLYQEFGETEVGKFDLVSNTSGYYKDLNEAFYGMQYHPQHEMLCTGITDFKTFGKVLVFTRELDLLFSFDAGVSPGYFAFESATVDVGNDPGTLGVILSPNPASGSIRVNVPGGFDQLEVFDALGTKLLELNHPASALDGLTGGTYWVRATRGRASGTAKLTVVQE